MTDRKSGRATGPRGAVAAAVTLASVVGLTACSTSTEVEDFVYYRAAVRAQLLGEELGRIFVARSDDLGIEDLVRTDSSAETGVARLWKDDEQNINWGGNWIIGIEQGATKTDIAADALIIIEGSSSGEIFGSRSASVLLCVRYLGELGSKRVRVVDGHCPDGVEEQLDTYHRVTVDQIAGYEVDE